MERYWRVLCPVVGVVNLMMLFTVMPYGVFLACMGDMHPSKISLQLGWPRQLYFPLLLPAIDFLSPDSAHGALHSVRNAIIKIGGWVRRTLTGFLLRWCARGRNRTERNSVKRTNIPVKKKRKAHAEESADHL